VVAGLRQSLAEELKQKEVLMSQHHDEITSLQLRKEQEVAAERKEKRHADKEF